MKMKLGNIVVKEDGVPQLEVRGTLEKQHTYYASPFRGYGFQVSGNDKGVNDCGASEFVGLNTIVKAQEPVIAKALFRALLLNALMKHNRLYDEVWSPSFEETQKMDEFINACYTWVVSEIDRIREQKLMMRLDVANKKQSIAERVKAKVFKQA